MCGIIGYLGNQNSQQVLIEGLKRLEYRGYDSAGIAVFLENKVQVFRSKGRISNLEKKIDGVDIPGKVGIGHTRWATHGPPAEINAHPHQVGRVTLVHNGIIENYMEHKQKITQSGRVVVSDTDSEIVAHLFDMELQAGLSLEDAVLKVLPQLEGTYAFVLVDEKRPQEILGVKNGAPLLVGLGEGENFLASDVQAILSHTKRVVYLEDKQYVLCTGTSVVVKDSLGQVVPFCEKQIDWTPDQFDMLGYKHYMLKEIHEQPLALANTIEGNIDHERGVICLRDLTLDKEFFRKISRISIAACGTALHAGLVAKYYFERFSNVAVEVDFASEFRYRDPILDENTLCVVISQSGETADTLAALRGAKEAGQKTLAICNVRESTIAREADTILYTNAGPEIGVASTKAFTTQVAVLYMLSVQLGFERDYLNLNQAIELTNDLLHVPIVVEKALAMSRHVEKVALELEGYNDFFFVGRGIEYPLALEGALKLKEISYLHAEGYPAGELKHGPIALIDKKMITVALVPEKKSYQHLHQNKRAKLSQLLNQKMLSNIEEVKARRGKILAITGKHSLWAKDCWQSLVLPEVSWGMSPIVSTIPLQLLSYYVALSRGTDVDKPRNLAKSVTVE